ncbi:MAG: hypothetical protein FH758_13195 [Firmicutes bacterium]|nr:hypothetical protein [Bacillota bacterium]
MKIEPQKCDFLTAYAVIDNEDVLMNELETFRHMAQRGRKKGLFSATKFEYKLLNRALDDGPEQLTETIRHLTPEAEQRQLMRIIEQAHKFLPFVVPDKVLSNWALKQVNRYFVKAKLREECEYKIETMMEAMTDSFVVNALIQSTRSDEDWHNMVQHIKETYSNVDNIKHLVDWD